MVQINRLMLSSPEISGHLSDVNKVADKMEYSRGRDWRHTCQQSSYLGRKCRNDRGPKEISFFRLLPLTLWILAGCYFQSVGALPEVIKLGGLFDIEDRYEETAFRHAIERVNAEEILPGSRLNAHWERVPLGDSFHASKRVSLIVAADILIWNFRSVVYGNTEHWGVFSSGGASSMVCQLLQEGIAVVFGPQSPQTGNLVQSVCDAMEVPHVETNWDFRSSRGNYMINLYPHPETLSRAYADVIAVWGWSRYIIIYENHESLIRLQEIIKDTDPTKKQDAFIKQLPPDDDYRPLFKELRTYAGISAIIIDCDSTKLKKIFEHARETGMMKDRRYFLTSLDIRTLDPEDFSQTDSINITSFSLVDPSKPKVQSIIEEWYDLAVHGFRNRSNNQNFFFDEARTRYRQPVPSPTEPVPNLSNNMLKTESALMYDAVELVARTLQILDSSQPERIEPRQLSCKEQDTWQQGHMVLDVLRKIQFEGITGNIEFDPNGFRRHLKLDIVELAKSGFSSIGVYDSAAQGDKFTWTRTEEETLRQQEEDLKDKLLYVTTITGNPYFMKTEEGNYTGFVPDLVDKLSELLGFRYEIREVADMQYGKPDNVTGRWNGMVGEVMSGVADIAVADLSINFDRESAVDFTMPFMNLGISILYKLPAKKPPSLFSFLEPFNVEVWIYMATAYLGVSLVLFLLARISPQDWTDPAPCSSDFGEIVENQFNMLNSLWFSTGSIMGQGCDILPRITPIQWQNPHPCKDDPDELENDMGVTNALWHNWGSLMQQGSDLAPRALSTRTVAGMWWFFTLIMISSYTANLAAFLANEGMEATIKDVKDLPKQNKVKYGALRGGTTARFFETQDFPLYKEIYSNMQTMKPDPYEVKTPLGIDRVKKSNGTYAFFMESLGIEYVIANDEECRLTQVGGQLDSKGYGIALRKNSQYRNAFSNAVLQLNEKGEIETLKQKWWKGKGACGKAAPSGGATPMSMQHVGGVYVVLLGGCAMACVMSMIEFIWKSRKLAKNIDENFWEAVWKELKFAILCQGDTKPVKKSKPTSEAPSMAGSVPYLAFDSKKEPSD